MPEQRNQNRHRDLDIGDAEPLIGEPYHVLAHVAIGQDEQPPLGPESVEDPPLHLSLRCARREIDAENVHRVVIPVAPVDAAIHQDAALLVGIIHHDANDGQMQDTVWTRNIQHVAQLVAAQQREIVRSENAFAFRPSTGTSFSDRPP